MKNTLVDLNNHLFMQLERLNNEGLTQDQIKDECARAKAITSLAAQAINNSRLVLDAERAKYDLGIDKLNPIRLASDSWKQSLIANASK